ncbi:MAG: uncharacterized protein JWP44_1886 [Mucilaginibacter sp.]|nr:uncharacterized protein [Mucilaginibacter sp.]
MPLLLNLKMLKVSQLFVYPIKSLPGIAVNEASVTEKGFEHDRRWMLVDANNRFISQREAPQMTQLLVSIEDIGLRITHRTNDKSITIPFGSISLGRGKFTVWDDTCTGEYVSDEADKWFTNVLGLNCRLVYMPDDNSKRKVDPNYAPENTVTSFSDAYPFLIIGQSSLDDLNSRLPEPLPIDRFRPNIVFTGGEPFEEDLMESFSIAGINFYGVKLCARCVIITINQNSGSKGKEPIKTLASYRSKNNKIYFGQNLVHEGNGKITVGDELHVKSLHKEERFIIPECTEKSTPIDIEKTFGIIVE